MKTWILAAVMMAGLTLSAQEKGEQREPLKPEQRAELHAKKMTLALDLNEKQQKDLQKLFTEQNKKAEQFKAQRKTGNETANKMTADERFAMQNKMLDEKIAMKADMKKILNSDQFAKWEKMRENHIRKDLKRQGKFRAHHKK
jgi:protein CpxP